MMMMMMRKSIFYDGIINVLSVLRANVGQVFIRKCQSSHTGTLVMACG